MLKLDWATHKAARYACERWHYSRCMPAGKLVKIGAWEDKRFIGVVIFGDGAGNSTRGDKYDLSPKAEVCELVRVALRSHETPVSRIIAIALRMLKQSNPKLRMVISFADTRYKHHGGIYQAGGWIYAGLTEADHEFHVRGEILHPRTVYARGWRQVETWLQEHIDPGARLVKTPAKHRYLMPLDAEMRTRLEPLAKPYPKREKQAMAGPPVQRRGSADLHAPGA